MIYRKAGLLKSPLYLSCETTPKFDMFVCWAEFCGHEPSVASIHGDLIMLLVSGLFPSTSHIPKDESTVGVDSGLIEYLSVSRMWHIAFATSLSSRHEAKPEGRYRRSAWA